MAWEDRKLYNRIKERLSQRETAMSKFNNARDTIATLFRPDLGIDTDESKRGTFFGESIYEGTAPWAARVMATGFQGNLVSPSVDWLTYLMDSSELRGIDELDVWCQDVKDHMTSVYRKSNFYSCLPQYTLDGLTMGSPVMFSEEEITSGRIMFMPQHYKHCFLCYNKYNQVDGIIIKDTTWTAKQIYETFITERTPDTKKTSRESKLSLAVNKALNEGQHYQEFTIIRAVFKSTDTIWDGGFQKPVGDYRWFSVYFEDGTDTDKQDKPLKTDGYFSRPFMTWDYNKKFYEPVSRTPAYDAIYDTLSHQQVHKNFLENIQLKNRPPRYALDTLKNKLDLSPEGITFVDNSEYNAPPKALDLIGDIQFNKELSDIFADALKRHFHLDLFQLFTQNAMTRKQPLTATQIWQMAGEKSTLLSPAVETYSNDLLKSGDDRCIDIEARAGRGPFAPDVVANIVDIVVSNTKTQIRSLGLTPEFIGPLARAQKIQQAADPIINGVQALRELAGTVGTDILNVVKPYELADKLLKAIHFPTDIVRTKEDYDNIIAGIQRQLMADKQLAQTLEMAKASKGVSGAVEPTSILGQMTGMGAEA